MVPRKLKKYLKMKHTNLTEKKIKLISFVCALHQAKVMNKIKFAEKHK